MPRKFTEEQWNHIRKLYKDGVVRYPLALADGANVGAAKSSISETIDFDMKHLGLNRGDFSVQYVEDFSLVYGKMIEGVVARNE